MKFNLFKNVIIIGMISRIEKNEDFKNYQKQVLIRSVGPARIDSMKK